MKVGLSFLYSSFFGIFCSVDNESYISGIVFSINLLTPPPLHSVSRSCILHFTFHIHVYIPYVLHSRPTDFHSSTRLNSGPHSAELVQSTKTTNGPVVDLFSCSTHHLTSPPPHLTTTTTTATTTATATTLSLVVPFPVFVNRLQSHYLLHKPPRGSSISFSISISLSPALSPGTHALYYVPVTRTVPVPFVFKRRRCGGVLQRWCVEELKLKKKPPVQSISLGFHHHQAESLCPLSLQPP